MNRVKIEITGIVQGVGFRPFIYALANSLNLSGNVLNNSTGVVIEAQGELEVLEAFQKSITTSHPVLARIDSLQCENIPLQEEKTFTILHSQESSEKSGFIPPDIAICTECCADIKNETSRFFNYPFTNCTNCGPRYSIIQTVPYDREKTSMAHFEMCQECREEYENPHNRRYHAQPISCPKCGVELTLYDNKKNKIDGDPIEKTVEFIKEGKIGVIKGIGGFHLVCDATNESVIEKLRERKNRKRKPFAVMFRDLKTIQKHTKLSSFEESLIDSFEKPIVIVHKKEESLPENIAPEIDRLGVFLPYTPLHILLLEKLQKPIIATSANLSGEAIIYKTEDIFQKLNLVVDFVLDNNREIINPCDDSIVQEVDSKRVILRSARGFTPTTFLFEDTQETKIGVGAHQKSSVSFHFQNKAILSPYIGDLESITNREYFVKTVESFKKFYEIEPTRSLRDLHDGYFSSSFAQDLKPIKIQHHYGHVLSVMAEKNIDREVLGVVFDGTGAGDDGTIWGGEFLVCNRREYKRVAHFKCFKLLGSASSIKDIRKIGISKLLDLFSVEEILELDVEVVKSFSEKEIRTMAMIHKKALNSPLTSSVGRIFDMVATLSGICIEQSYEGESGLKIEKYYNKKITATYPFLIEDSTVDIDAMIKEILKEKSKELVASKFINTLVEISVVISKKFLLPVVICGGVFQNRTLLEVLVQRLSAEDIEYFFQERTSLNDGSISLGQIYYFG